MRYRQYRCLGCPDNNLLGCSFYRNHLDVMMKDGHITPGSVWKQGDKYFIIEGAYFEQQDLVPISKRRVKALALRFKMLEFVLNGGQDG